MKIVEIRQDKSGNIKIVEIKGIDFAKGPINTLGLNCKDCDRGRLSIQIDGKSGEYVEYVTVNSVTYVKRMRKPTNRDDKKLMVILDVDNWHEQTPNENLYVHSKNIDVIKEYYEITAFMNKHQSRQYALLVLNKDSKLFIRPEYGRITPFEWNGDELERWIDDLPIEVSETFIAARY